MCVRMYVYCTVLSCDCNLTRCSSIPWTYRWLAALATPPFAKRRILQPVKRESHENIQVVLGEKVNNTTKCSLVHCFYEGASNLVCALHRFLSDNSWKIKGKGFGWSRGDDMIMDFHVAAWAEVVTNVAQFFVRLFFLMLVFSKVSFVQRNIIFDTSLWIEL